MAECSEIAAVHSVTNLAMSSNITVKFQKWKTLDNKHLGFIFVVFFSIFTEIENLNNKKIRYNTIIFQFVTTWITEEDQE